MKLYCVVVVSFKFSKKFREMPTEKCVDAEGFFTEDFYVASARLAKFRERNVKDKAYIVEVELEE